MRKVIVDDWKNIPAGAKVPSGFGHKLTAPQEAGYYNLYELVGKGNTHCGWKWEKVI